jgi:hypothetical protein
MKTVTVPICFLIPFLIQTSFSQPCLRIYAAHFEDLGRQVYSCDLDGSGMVEMVMPLRPKCVAVDWLSTPQKLYVGLVPISGDGRIVRCNADGTEMEDVITDAVGINDIELDLVHRKIFWLMNTYSDDRIFHADMDGVDANITQIYATTTPGRDLWGLALDVSNERLWITERGSNCYASYIRSMSFSGGGVTIVRYPVCNPHGIEYFNGRIYWGDTYGLETANPDGSGIDTVVGGGHVDGLAIDGSNNRIYWVDYYGFTVKRVDIDGTNRMDVIGGLGILSGIDTDYNPAAVPVEVPAVVPEATSLFQNYPNPFNPATTISFDLPGRVDVRIAVYSLLGQQVRVLVQGEYEAGRHTVNVDASDLASGVYLYRMQAGRSVQVRKMTVMR